MDFHVVCMSFEYTEYHIKKNSSLSAAITNNYDQ